MQRSRKIVQARGVAMNKRRERAGTPSTPGTIHSSESLRPLYQKERQLGFGRKHPLQTLRSTEPKTLTKRSAVDHTGIGTILFDLLSCFPNKILTGAFELQFPSDNQCIREKIAQS